jgi:hypothetical protein
MPSRLNCSRAFTGSGASPSFAALGSTLSII